MNAVRNKVVELVKEELDTANQFFPMFCNPHEGYAVILEEAEETELEYKMLKYTLANIWEMIKQDLGFEIEMRNEMEILRDHAINTAAEAIQIAAMADKYISSLIGKVKDEI